jgi:heat shock protein HslJ
MTQPEVGPAATSDALAGTEWSIASIEGRPIVAHDAPLVVAFGHDGRVSGTTGVNQLTASYSLTDEYLTFGPTATTRRAGSPEAMEQEQRVLAALAGMCPYRLSTHLLVVEGPLGVVELVSTAPVPPPATAVADAPGEPPSVTG